MSNVLKGDYLAADEGKFFTSDQGIVASTAVQKNTIALGKTSPELVIFNGQPAGGKNLYMRYAKFTTTTAITTITSVQYVGVLNSGASGDIHTTVGTLMSTPTNNNGDLDNPSLTKLYGGVNVMATPGAASRTVHVGEVDNSIPIVLDTWNLVYGETSVPDVKIGTMSLVKHITTPVSPVIIAPQQYYSLGFWGAAWQAAAASYRINVGWLEL